MTNRAVILMYQAGAALLSGALWQEVSRSLSHIHPGIDAGVAPATSTKFRAVPKWEASFTDLAMADKDRPGELFTCIFML